MAKGVFVVLMNKIRCLRFQSERDCNGEHLPKAGWRLFYPDLKLPEKETQSVGIWGQRHKRCLREYNRLLYTTLFTSGKLNSYLADIDEQAREMFSRLVEQMAERGGVTEQFKAVDQMAWVGAMNNIRNRATEIVNAELIYN